MNPRTLLANFLSAIAATLVLPSVALAESQTASAAGDAGHRGDNGEDDELHAAPSAFAWGVGAGLVAGIGGRHGIEKAFYPMGLSMEVHLGTALTSQLATGLAIRGGWLVLPPITVRGASDARRTDELEAAALWYQEWGAGPSFRLGVGPYTSAMLGNPTLVNDAALFGAEANFQVGFRGGARAHAIPTFWLSAILDHALGGSSDHGLGRERETAFKLGVGFALEHRGDAPKE